MWPAVAAPTKAEQSVEEEEYPYTNAKFNHARVLGLLNDLFGR